MPFISAVQLCPGLDRFADMHLTHHAYFAREAWRVARGASSLSSYDTHNFSLVYDRLLPHRLH